MAIRQKRVMGGFEILRKSLYAVFFVSQTPGISKQTLNECESLSCQHLQIRGHNSLCK